MVTGLNRLPGKTVQGVLLLQTGRLACRMGRRMEHVAEYPDFLARFYDVIYAQIRHGIDDEFYFREILSARGPVLEIGTGTGRFFVEALKKGVDIYGLDNSAHMLSVLKSKMPAEHHRRIFLQDARKMELGRTFNLIIAPFRVFSHFLTSEDQLEVLNRISDHLTADGRLIFDLYVPNLKMIMEGLDNEVDFAGEYAPGEKIRRVTSMKADLITQQSDVSMRFIWDEKGREVEREFKFKMRFYFRFELEHLVCRSRLKLAAMYGDYDETPLRSDSKEFIVVCAK
jgi:hypothetical protein